MQDYKNLLTLAMMGGLSSLSTYSNSFESPNVRNPHQKSSKYRSPGSVNPPFQATRILGADGIGLSSRQRRDSNRLVQLIEQAR